MPEPPDETPEPPDETPEPSIAAPPRRRRGRVTLAVGVALALVGLAAVVLGSLRLASAAAVRKDARETASERMEVEAMEARIDSRRRETALLADRLRDAEVAVFDGYIGILRSADRVTALHNDLVAAFNRSVDAFDAGNSSGGRAIIENEVEEALQVVARAVRKQDRRLSRVREALAEIKAARRG